jgi:hypothetical protein
MVHNNIKWGTLLHTLKGVVSATPTPHEDMTDKELENHIKKAQKEPGVEDLAKVYGQSPKKIVTIRPDSSVLTTANTS